MPSSRTTNANADDHWIVLVISEEQRQYKFFNKFDVSPLETLNIINRREELRTF